jgi:hypothetical protein
MIQHDNANDAENFRARLMRMLLDAPRTSTGVPLIIRDVPRPGSETALIRALADIIEATCVLESPSRGTRSPSVSSSVHGQQRHRQK